MICMFISSFYDKTLINAVTCSHTHKEVYSIAIYKRFIINYINTQLCMYILLGELDVCIAISHVIALGNACSLSSRTCDAAI